MVTEKTLFFQIIYISIKFCKAKRKLKELYKQSFFQQDSMSYQIQRMISLYSFQFNEIRISPFIVK